MPLFTTEYNSIGTSCSQKKSGRQQFRIAVNGPQEIENATEASSSRNVNQLHFKPGKLHLKINTWLRSYNDSHCPINDYGPFVGQTDFYHSLLHRVLSNLQNFKGLSLSV